MLTSDQFIALVDELQLQFDAIVETGTDDELFLSGYLNGHFSLVASQCINQQLFSAQSLDEKMKASLGEAFSKGELEPADQDAVHALWDKTLLSFHA